MPWRCWARAQDTAPCCGGLGCRENLCVHELVHINMELLHTRLAQCDGKDVRLLVLQVEHLLALAPAIERPLNEEFIARVPGVTTEEIPLVVHQGLLENGVQLLHLMLGTED
eukprot:CAMPEP_0180456042 /NCGR_PEP_ID=MMETSP1036_2-20121128/21102_1 /TAXON_ID=632150 /ORGANISM="Azadinium spinosum, Strain 3D9" /LENGTH=111 /DNA_ID=CAMNT_0022462605 /DNA_START=177 /DNA_END=512 /DNA_ORIENTATION=+